MDREIRGQIRIDGKPAPQGVLVLLDLAPGFDSKTTGAGEFGQTMTDSSGRFVFDHLLVLPEDPKRFMVTVRYPGYRHATQVVDLTGSPRGYVSLELQRDTSRDVPTGDPHAAISAKQPSSSAAREALAKGQKLLVEKHDAKASIDSFKKVISLEPGYGHAYLLLGTAYMQTREWGEAQSAFEQGAKADPQNPFVFLGIGAALNQEGRYEQAQAPLRHSLELNSETAEAHYELARAYWALRKFQDAEGHVHKAIELNKDYPSPHVLMGNIDLMHRDLNSALSEFQEYLRLDPHGDQAGAVKQSVEKIEKAINERSGVH